MKKIKYSNDLPRREDFRAIFLFFLPPLAFPHGIEPVVDRVELVQRRLHFFVSFFDEHGDDAFVNLVDFAFYQGFRLVEDVLVEHVEHFRLPFESFEKREDVESFLAQGKPVIRDSFLGEVHDLELGIIGI